MEDLTRMYNKFDNIFISKGQRSTLLLHDIDLQTFYSTSLSNEGEESKISHDTELVTLTLRIHLDTLVTIDFLSCWVEVCM